jgi:hypothetical protein
MESAAVVFGGKYRVEGRIGSGGEGIAYLVRNPEGASLLFLFFVVFLTL